MREAAPRLRPGAYLIGVAPDAALLPYQDLRSTMMTILSRLEDR